MISAESQLRKRLEAALRARDRTAAKILRNVMAAAKNRRIELKLAGDKPLDAKELMTILNREAKQTREALEFAEKAGRTSLVEEARAELALLEEMLPSQLSGDALRAAIEAIIEETGAEAIGPVMKELGARYAGGYDGREASGAVAAALEQRGR